MTIVCAAAIKYGFGTAFEVLCASAPNDLRTPDQQKALQAINKKMKEQAGMAWNGANKRPIQDSTQASGIAHRDEFPDIPTNGQETARTAWFNWTLVSHPFSAFCCTTLRCAAFRCG